MLDRKDFKAIKKELDSNNEISEAVFRDSRNLIGMSKKMI